MVGPDATSQSISACDHAIGNPAVRIALAPNADNAKPPCVRWSGRSSNRKGVQARDFRCVDRMSFALTPLRALLESQQGFEDRANFGDITRHPVHLQPPNRLPPISGRRALWLR